MARKRRGNIRVLVTILAAQIAAMSLMLGAAALVIEDHGPGQEVAGAEPAAEKAARDSKCVRRVDLLELLLF